MSAPARAEPAVESGGLTRALGERAVSLRYEDLPTDVVEIASQALLDWFAVTLAGSTEVGPRALLETLLASGETAGEGTVVGHARSLPPLRCALVNGTSSHVLDFDDVNLTFLGHATVAVLAAVLALAEQRDAGVSELLSAYVAGYETTCRIAAALGPEPYLRGAHATGTVGTLGAAAACARLLGLDPDAAAAALGIAASEAAGLKANFGTMTKSLHAGNACQGGMLAALLAGGGFTANAGAIEADAGFAAVAGGGCDVAAALADPPSGWHLRENVFKHHASCFFTHSAIEGARELAAGGLEAEEVERVAVHVGELELGACVIPAPATALEVKFSIAHLVAMALLGRSTVAIDDDAARDPAVIALRERVVLAPDGHPGEATLVELVLRDGTGRSARRDVGTPERDLDAQRARLSEKYDALVAGALPDGQAERLRASLADLDGEGRVRALLALARV
jgi:2-methylcitrate dehydratase PrpD